MGWILRVSPANTNAGASAQPATRAFVQCDGTRNASRHIVCLTISPEMSQSLGAALVERRAMRAWQQVLSTLAGFD